MVTPGAYRPVGRVRPHTGPFGIEMIPVTRNEEEPNRVLGIPRKRIGPASQRDRQGREPQRALGFPISQLSVDVGFFRSLLHPIKGYRRRSRRHRMGAYALDDDDTGRG